MPNDSFSALWLMIIMTICGNPATTLTSFLSHPFSPWNRQADKNPAADSIKRGVRQTWLAAGMCVYHSGQDSELIQESSSPIAWPMLVAPIDFPQATTGKIPLCEPSLMAANYGGCSP